MFEFFIALFGGLFYGGVHLKERQTEKQHKTEWQHYDNWKNKLLSYGDVRRLYEDFDNDKIKHDLLDSIDEELKEVFGENWRNIYAPNCVNIRDYCIGSFGWSVKQILLSKMGKIEDVAFTLRGLPDMYIRAAILTCKIIERNIQQIYPEIHMVFEYGYLDVWGAGNKKPNRKYFTELPHDLHTGKIIWSFSPVAFISKTMDLQTLCKTLEQL